MISPNPYDPPPIPEPESLPARRAVANDEYDVPPFRSPILLAVICSLLMGIDILLVLVAAYCAMALYRASGGEFSPPGELDVSAITLWSESWNNAAVVSWPLIVIAHLFMIAWTYRCHRNLESLGHCELDSKHIWALLCWFIPVLNLFCPYQVVCEIWWRSHPLAAGTPDSAPASHLVFCWWLMRMTALGTALLSRWFSNCASWSAYYTFYRIAVLNLGSGLLAAFLAMIIIWRISQWQLTRHRSLQSAAESAPEQR